jgi:hypothetical protein
VLADDVTIPAGLTISDAAVVPLERAGEGTAGRAAGPVWIAPLTPNGDASA